MGSRLYLRDGKYVWKQWRPNSGDRQKHKKGAEAREGPGTLSNALVWKVREVLIFFVSDTCLDVEPDKRRVCIWKM